VAVVAGTLLAILGAFVAGQGGVVAAVALLYLGLSGAMVWIMVRLSVAAPLTLLRGKIVLREAWQLTKGRFWTLFGAYFVVMFVVAVAFTVLMSITMGDYFSAMLQSTTDPAAAQELMRAQMERAAPGRPIWFVMLIAGGAVGAAAIALTGATNAIAARDLLEGAG
jgi:hypothetical protein